MVGQVGPVLVDTLESQEIAVFLVGLVYLGLQDNLDSAVGVDGQDSQDTVVFQVGQVSQGTPV